MAAQVDEKMDSLKNRTREDVPGLQTMAPSLAKYNPYQNQGVGGVVHGLSLVHLAATQCRIL